MKKYIFLPTLFLLFTFFFFSNQEIQNAQAQTDLPLDGTSYCILPSVNPTNPTDVGEGGTCVPASGPYSLSTGIIDCEAQTPMHPVAYCTTEGGANNGQIYGYCCVPGATPISPTVTPTLTPTPTTGQTGAVCSAVAYEPLDGDAWRLSAIPSGGPVCLSVQRVIAFIAYSPTDNTAVVGQSFTISVSGGSSSTGVIGNAEDEGIINVTLPTSSNGAVPFTITGPGVNLTQQIFTSCDSSSTTCNVPAPQTPTLTPTTGPTSTPTLTPTLTPTPTTAGGNTLTITPSHGCLDTPIQVTFHGVTFPVAADGYFNNTGLAAPSSYFVEFGFPTNPITIYPNQMLQYAPPSGGASGGTLTTQQSNNLDYSNLLNGPGAYPIIFVFGNTPKTPDASALYTVDASCFPATPTLTSTPTTTPVPACGSTCGTGTSNTCSGATGGCSVCDPGTNTCQTPPACGTTCTSDSSCNGAGGGCSSCVSGVCSIPNTTKLAFTIFLDDIGKYGDNANPTNTSFSNPSPSHPTRTLNVTVFDSNNTLVGSPSGTITYNSSAGNFTGVIDMGNLSTGDYIIKAKTDMYLQRLFSAIQHIQTLTTNIVPTKNMIAGDINDDNQLDVEDYNILRDCGYGALNPLPISDPTSEYNSPTCQSHQFKNNADLNDDGIIDSHDFNLFIRELSVQAGD